MPAAAFVYAIERFAEVAACFGKMSLNGSSVGSSQTCYFRVFNDWQWPVVIRGHLISVLLQILY